MSTDLNTTIPFEWISCTDDRDPGDIASLAADIKAQGLLQPIRLVCKGKSQYEVVDGRRRFAALQSLGDTALHPGQWVEHDAKADGAALRVAAFSANTQRKPLTLAEEVQQLNELHKTYTIPQLAETFGRTESYVALRLHLAQLSPKWRDNVLNHPEEYPQWTAAKLELVARETEAVQEEFYIEYNAGRCWTEAELREHFSDKYKEVASFPFDTAECLKCPKRSSQNGLLFAEFGEAEGDKCLDAICYGKKLAAYIKLLRKQLPKAQLVKEENSYQCGNDYIRKLGYEAPCKMARLPKEGERPNAICIWGPHAGHAVVIKEEARAVPVKRKLDPAVELKVLEESREKKINKATAESFGERLRVAKFDPSIDKLNVYLNLWSYFVEKSAWSLKEETFDDAMKQPYPLTVFVRALLDRVAGLAEHQSNYWDGKNLPVLRKFAEAIGQADLFYAARAEALAANAPDKKLEALRLKVKQEKAAKKAKKEVEK